ncbi:hypothetical protein BCR43DRAFT_482520 [Syncephalastrum racemosum]|uniref:Zn(2)-C6 fungal-type domain-containing protein n=1 Tax=Syncephalastrum racemosum TaxID=13706 RepID=A0A1X2HU09_SYNRA|nr:hypothetical protein BCR43DRAFT_482520 [Syncephalastrum racemosum]
MMPSSPPPNRSSPNRHVLAERCYTVRTCEQCRRRRRACDGQRPCTHCAVGDLNCVYSVVSDLPRTVFLTSTARRLSSGSACETCRRRKTKCDGATPCAYCASAGIPCVNNSERRKRFMGIPSPPKPSTSADSPDADAIDRIEDRLQRIEKLMTAFAPAANSPLSSQSQPPHSAKQASHHQVDPSFRKPLSSPPPRKHRHSVQGISVAKEQAELRTAYALKKKRAGLSPPPSPFRTETNNAAALARYATPPNSGGSTTSTINNSNANNSIYTTSSPPAYHPHATPSPPPPPLSPTNNNSSNNTTMVRQNSAHTQPLTSSMLNLTLSPSSSTSSSSSMLQPQSSISTPQRHMTTSPASKVIQTTSPPSSSRSTDSEWKLSSASMPSLMDQLSKRTFGPSALHYSNGSSSNNKPIYPPYPLTPPHSYPRQDAHAPPDEA